MSAHVFAEFDKYKCKCKYKYKCKYKCKYRIRSEANKNNLDEKLCSKLRWLAGKRSAMCGTDHAQMLACLNTIQFSLVGPVLLKVSDESDFIFGKQRKCKWSSRALVLKQLFKPSDFEKSKSLCYKDNGKEAPQ